MENNYSNVAAALMAYLALKAKVSDIGFYWLASMVIYKLVIELWKFYQLGL